MQTIQGLYTHTVLTILQSFTIRFCGIKIYAEMVEESFQNCVKTVKIACLEVWIYWSNIFTSTNVVVY